MKPVPFESPAAFRRWLERNHAATSELMSGRGGLTYAEALDEALCFGWIDGIRRRVDAESYTIRFTPRKPGSIWSLVNVRHFDRLAKIGRIQAAGQAAFDRRDPKKTGIYSFENRPKKLPGSLEKIFRANPSAWAFWKKQPSGYQRLLTWYVLSAKQEATRLRRLATLVAKSAAGERIR